MNELILTGLKSVVGIAALAWLARAVITQVIQRTGESVIEAQRQEGAAAIEQFRREAATEIEQQRKRAAIEVAEHTEKLGFLHARRAPAVLALGAQITELNSKIELVRYYAINNLDTAEELATTADEIDGLNDALRASLKDVAIFLPHDLVRRIDSLSMAIVLGATNASHYLRLGRPAASLPDHLRSVQADVGEIMSEFRRILGVTIE